MNLPGNASAKMDVVQQEFLRTQEEIEKFFDSEDINTILEARHPEFRSIAYESASMVIGLRDLSGGMKLDNWKKFRERSANEHDFHIDIGLGWAFAKTGISPALFLEHFTPVTKGMVFDGMGYYYALFKGRKTIKEQVVPSELKEDEKKDFDQGIGRRCWYMAKGDVKEVTRLTGSFPEQRQPDLWRGVGIACGYVGGNSTDDLELLVRAAGNYREELQTGILLAAVSRIASNSITPGIEAACQVVCNRAIEEIKELKNPGSKQSFLSLLTG